METDFEFIRVQAHFLKYIYKHVILHFSRKVKQKLHKLVGSFTKTHRVFVILTACLTCL